MKILVTGGAGFIGSHLCDSLLACQHEITAVDNLSLGIIDNVSHLFNNPQFRFIQGDVLDDVLMQRLATEGHFDMVYHLAANSDIAKSHKHPEVDFQNTFLTTFKILELMRNQNINKILFASTSAIYGEVSNSKFSENFGPLRPVSHYGAGKLASESFISSYSTNYGIQAWIVRFPNVVGERSTHGVIFDFIRKLSNNKLELEILGNGTQRKPYVYVKELVEAILYVTSKTNSPMNIYNLGDESSTTVSEIAAMVIEELGLSAKIRYTGGDRGWVGDVPSFDYDLDKIHSLGWKAKLSSNEAVRLAIRGIIQRNSK